MLYASWFVFPTILLLIFLVFMLVRGWLIDKKKAFSILGAVCVITIIAFYFIIPVPFAVQAKEVKVIKNFLANNNEASNVNMQLWKEVNCSGGYLKGYQYFEFQRAFRNDFNITLERNGMVAFGQIDAESTSKENELCKVTLKK